ncbi:triacylglycerol lipase [Alphaentomopoxvirus acuprea]|uniref:Triacylglycerol lipase n=1 Tax=Alphaentomopoxvirus acuprea TaxID=62099 RepID=W6JIW7_9POXV|nr:triacylglycerol lipase [Anomala cuprea entomopoxvirus]BAO49543.1 triacylglycerol lipase [Anomala cuprea entomopoxvirus]
MEIYKIIIWIVIITSIIAIIFLYIIIHIKRCIYDILNENIYIAINEDIIYPKQFDIDTFNTDIFKYLIKLLIDFNSEIMYSCEAISYENINKIFYISYNKKPLVKILVDNNNYVWIVIRGTLTYNEFEQDLRISQYELHDNIKCHYGFTDIYYNIRKELLYILKYINPKYIFGLGHSLGGGILSIASLDLFSAYQNIILYVTGTPRICNRKFNDIISKYNLYKIENLSDIYINAIPPILPFYNNLSYSKIGKVIYFDDNRDNIIINHKIEIYYENISKYSILTNLKLSY